MAFSEPVTDTALTAGNYKLVCLVHANMTGVVHVLNVSEPLPYDQAAYDQLSRVAVLRMDNPVMESEDTSVCGPSSILMNTATRPLLPW